MKKTAFLKHSWILIMLSFCSCSNGNKPLPENYQKCTSGIPAYSKIDNSREAIQSALGNSAWGSLSGFEYFGKYDGYDVIFFDTLVKGETPWKIGEYWFTWKNAFYLIAHQEETDTIEWLNFIYDDGKISIGSLTEIWTKFRSFFKYRYVDSSEYNFDKWAIEALCDYYLENNHVNYCDYLSRINPVEEESI